MSDYINKQLADLKPDKLGKLWLKVISADGTSSNHINITPAQLAAVIKALTA